MRRPQCYASGKRPINRQVSCDKFWHLMNDPLTYHIEVTLTSLSHTHEVTQYGQILIIWTRKIPVYYPVQLFRCLNCLIEYPLRKFAWLSNTYNIYVFPTSDPMPAKIIPCIIALCMQSSFPSQLFKASIKSTETSSSFIISYTSNYFILKPVFGFVDIKKNTPIILIWHFGNKDHITFNVTSVY